MKAIESILEVYQADLEIKEAREYCCEIIINRNEPFIYIQGHNWSESLDYANNDKQFKADIKKVETLPYHWYAS